MNFVVEGRYFDDAIQAFTFAQIQATRMDRPVEVRLNVSQHTRPWHATAYPDGYERTLVRAKTAPKRNPALELAVAAA